jgi:hypothetical protein
MFIWYYNKNVIFIFWHLFSLIVFQIKIKRIIVVMAADNFVLLVTFIQLAICIVGICLNCAIIWISIKNKWENLKPIVSILTYHINNNANLSGIYKIAMAICWPFILSPKSFLSHPALCQRCSRWWTSKFHWSHAFIWSDSRPLEPLIVPPYRFFWLALTAFWLLSFPCRKYGFIYILLKLLIILTKIFLYDQIRCWPVYMCSTDDPAHIRCDCHDSF